MTLINFIKRKLIVPLVDIRSRINNLKIHKLERQIKALNHRLYNSEMLYKNLVSIGVDVHFKSPHMILIYSESNGGQLYHIPFIGDFKELRNLVRDLKDRYNTNRVTIDQPPHMRNYW